MCSFLFTNCKDFYLEDINFLLKKRGPDNTSEFRNGDFLYIHNLLSITGEFTTQPMLDEGLIVLFNGEIYNYKEFGNFKSDSECISYIYKEKGIGGMSDLDGEFSIFIHDQKINRFFLVTDTFGTKPLYLSIENGKIGVSSYPEPLKKLGFKIHDRCYPNTVKEIDSDSFLLISEKELFTFDLSQKKEKFDDWKSAFKRSIEKRTKNLKFPFLVPLSSGYDSGLICCALNEMKVDYISFSILGKENTEIINSRIKLNRNTIKEIKDSLTPSDKESIIEEFNKNVQPFYYGPNPYDLTHNGFEDPGSFGLYYILKESISKYGTKIVLSGQGSDEIMSNIQTYGFRTKNPEFFGPDLKSIFPWGNFYLGSQWSYLMKEECLAGSLGIETRYPFLDRDLVQEYLWLIPDLKNKCYKSPIKDFFDDFSYPYHDQKIGFNIER